MKILLPVAVLFATACNCEDGYFDLSDEEDITDEILWSYIEKLDEMEVEVQDLRREAKKIIDNLSSDLESYPAVKKWKTERSMSNSECQKTFSSKLSSLKNEIELTVAEYAASLDSIYRDMEEIEGILKDDLQNERSFGEADYANEPISETVKSLKSKVNLLILTKKLFPYGNRQSFLLNMQPRITDAIDKKVVVPYLECLKPKGSLTGGS